MTAPLFEPLAIGPVTVPNRIAVAPMCQYSAHDGVPDQAWHLQHWMNLAMSGAGLVMIEATGVERRGRISHGCLGLWNDDQEAAIATALVAARRVALPGTRFGIQLQHAGRKASAQRPWEGGKPLAPEADPWTTVAPSAVPFDTGWHVPEALDEAGLARVRDAFAAAARRAARLGIEVIEIHLAHGYLLHQFTSPLANTRTDRYGGSLENRLRFPLEVMDAVRAAVAPTVAVGARITGSDWSEQGMTPAEGVALARALRDHGADYVCVTSGGIAPGIAIPVGPGYQVPFAARVRKEVGIVTRAVGLLVDPAQVNAVIADGQADQVALARAFLDDPRWGWHAAERLGASVALPPAYDRVRAASWPGAALARPAR